jgi:hypothetical protein
MTWGAHAEFLHFMLIMLLADGHGGCFVASHSEEVVELR